MPEVGEIRKATEIGQHDPGKCIWHACIDCGKKRWVRLRKNKPVNLKCRICNGGKCPNRMSKMPKADNHWNWQGGNQTAHGYILILLPPDNFFSPMTDKRGYIFKHRFIMARHFGRCLQSWEVVHHINGMPDDNRLENLMLLTKAEHTKLHKELKPS